MICHTTVTIATHSQMMPIGRAGKNINIISAILRTTNHTHPKLLHEEQAKAHGITQEYSIYQKENKWAHHIMSFYLK